MADGITMTVPIELLALAELCGDSGTKYDQVRFGRDAESPWAAATDSKVFGLARWWPHEGDALPPVGAEFGVPPGVLDQLAALVVADGRGSWRDGVTVSGGAAELTPSYSRHGVRAFSEPPGAWIGAQLFELTSKSARSTAETPPDHASCHGDPRVLARPMSVAEAMAGSQFAAVRMRVVRHGGLFAWQFAVAGRWPDDLNRRLHFWALAMCLSSDTDMRPWETPEPPAAAAAPAVPPGYRWAGEPNRATPAGAV